MSVSTKPTQLIQSINGTEYANSKKWFCSKTLQDCNISASYFNPQWNALIRYYKTTTTDVKDWGVVKDESLSFYPPNDKILHLQVFVLEVSINMWYRLIMDRGARGYQFVLTSLLELITISSWEGKYLKWMNATLKCGICKGRWSSSCR